MTLQDDENYAIQDSFDRIEAMLVDAGAFTHEDVERIRSRYIRIIGAMLHTERNLVEHLGRATIRAEQLEDANAALVAALAAKS